MSEMGGRNYFWECFFSEKFYSINDFLQKNKKCNIVKKEILFRNISRNYGFHDFWIALYF